MDRLLTLPSAVLIGGWLAAALAIALASRVAVRALVPNDEYAQARGIAAPLMPALGAAFAILMALTLASEAGYLRSAQDIVSNEAAESSRLAWAATNPGVDTAAIQTALLSYLKATRTREWRGIGSVESHDATTTAAIDRLESSVRAEASRAGVSTPVSTELVASLDAVTTGRRARIAAAARAFPLLYVITLGTAGVALIVDAGALTLDSSARAAVLVLGLAAVVGLSMALLFALSGPWEGQLVVSGHPIDVIVRDLSAGYFR